MPPLARAAAAAVLSALAHAGPAAAADRYTPLPDRTLRVTAPGTTTLSCRTLAAPGTPGIWQTRYTAPGEGLAGVRLRGGRRSGDWDLAAFDPRTRGAVGVSLGFGAEELAQSWMRSGATVVLQACRRPGAAATIRATVGYGLAAWPAPAAPVRLVRIPLGDTRRQVPRLLALGIDVDESVYPDHAVATVTPGQLRRLTAAGFAARVLTRDVLAADRSVLTRDRARATRTAPLGLRADAAPGLPSGRASYRRYADHQADLKRLVAEYPGLVRPYTMPVRSFQGREQMGVELSAAVDATDDQKPVSLILGVHHAREWPAGELPLEFAFLLAQGYGRDPRITRLLDRTRVFVVPIVNPDGFVASRDAADPADALGDPAGLPSLVESVGAGGSLAYRRKNCHGAIASPDAPCELQLGVDPNRNYGFGWGGPGASTSPGSQSYRGTGPWSEAETQSVHRFSQTHAVTTLVTTHTFAGLVLRPPGLSADGPAPDEERLKHLGDAMAAATGYTSQHSHELYDTSGTTEDWNYGAAGTYGYTIELGPAAGEDGNFHAPFARAVTDQWNGTGPQAGRGMREAYLTAAEHATSRRDFPALAGTAPAGRTLRLRRSFRTFTSPVCTLAGPTDLDPIDVANGLSGQTGNPLDCVAPTAPTAQDDHLEYTTRVGASGRFDWLVTPSTRPFDHRRGLRQAWTLSCEDAAGTVHETRQVEVWRNETATLRLRCGGRPPSAAGRRDRTPPRSRFTPGRQRTTRFGLLLNGTARDRAPRGLTPRLQAVAVAVGRVLPRGRCRFVQAGGRFGPSVDCARPRYLPARGTTRWSFVLRQPLAPGRYLAWVRGVDASGNLERRQRTRNLLRFAVR